MGPGILSFESLEKIFWEDKLPNKIFRVVLFSCALIRPKIWLINFVALEEAKRLILQKRKDTKASDLNSTRFNIVILIHANSVFTRYAVMSTDMIVFGVSQVKTWALSADVSRPKSVFRRFLFQYLQGRLAVQKKRKVSLISALTVASNLGDICALARSCMYAQCKK